MTPFSPPSREAPPRPTRMCARRRRGRSATSAAKARRNNYSSCCATTTKSSAPPRRKRSRNAAIKDTTSLDHQRLVSTELYVRSTAAWALGEIRDPDARLTLQRAVGDINSLVRDAAKEALAKLPETKP